jgi:hypothetical protein
MTMVLDACALALGYVEGPLPPFVPASATKDNWQETAWD